MAMAQKPKEDPKKEKKPKEAVEKPKATRAVKPKTETVKAKEEAAVSKVDSKQANSNPKKPRVTKAAASKKEQKEPAQREVNHSGELVLKKYNLLGEMIGE